LLRQEARWLDLVVSKNQELNLWTWIPIYIPMATLSMFMCGFTK
jgi:hypothetical protein